MNPKNILTGCLLGVLLFCSNSCGKKYLDLLPEDKITSANFPKTEKDIKLLLNGTYSLLRAKAIYTEGFLGFGIMDGATPNAYNWGNTPIDKAGDGQLSSSDGEMLTFLWTRCYNIVFLANNLLNALDIVELSDEAKTAYVGEAHFLRGFAYSILADAYGGVPLITKSITTEEARMVTRATRDETWNQATDDYDIAIANLKADAPQLGRATKGAALGLEMRAYLYQGKYDKVLQIADQIDALGKYSLFPSYAGLFTLAHENNQEVLFDVQYMRGENSQGSLLDQYCGTGTGPVTRGTRYVPTQDLIDAYEKIDGSAGKYSDYTPDLDNPYQGWDPRMQTTVVVPGAYFLGYRFPNYIYQGGAVNHPGNPLKQFSTRKYRIEPIADLPIAGQSDLNYIVMRYADVILSKAEAIIEINGDIDEAVGLINKIRTGRDDVKLTPLPTGLSQNEARQGLRHERRIEFALEGLYWSDIRRWDIGKDLYPIVIKDQNGGTIETKFPGGYLEYFNLLPIPQSEISLNNNLEQNPGW